VGLAALRGWGDVGNAGVAVLPGWEEVGDSGVAALPGWGELGSAGVAALPGWGELGNARIAAPVRGSEAGDEGSVCWSRGESYAGSSFCSLDWCSGRGEDAVPSCCLLWEPDLSAH